MTGGVPPQKTSNHAMTSHDPPGYVKRLEELGVECLDVWMELDGFESVEDHGHLDAVDDGEHEVPGQNVWATHDYPGPHRQ